MSSQLLLTFSIALRLPDDCFLVSFQINQVVLVVFFGTDHSCLTLMLRIANYNVITCGCVGWHLNGLNNLLELVLYYCFDKC